MKVLPDKLYKTRIIIWTDFNPMVGWELSALAREAESGDAYCSCMKAECVDPRLDKDFDGTDFFGFDEDDHGKEQSAEKKPSTRRTHRRGARGKGTGRLGELVARKRGRSRPR